MSQATIIANLRREVMNSYRSICSILKVIRAAMVLAYTAAVALLVSGRTLSSSGTAPRSREGGAQVDQSVIILILISVIVPLTIAWVFQGLSAAIGASIDNAEVAGSQSGGSPNRLERDQQASDYNVASNTQDHNIAGYDQRGGFQRSLARQSVHNNCTSRVCNTSCTSCAETVLALGYVCICNTRASDRGIVACDSPCGCFVELRGKPREGAISAVRFGDGYYVAQYGPVSYKRSSKPFRQSSEQAHSGSGSIVQGDPVRRSSGGAAATTSVQRGVPAGAPVSFRSRWESERTEEDVKDAFPRNDEIKACSSCQICPVSCCWCCHSCECSGTACIVGCTQHVTPNEPTPPVNQTQVVPIVSGNNATATQTVPTDHKTRTDRTAATPDGAAGARQSPHLHSSQQTHDPLPARAKSPSGLPTTGEASASCAQREGSSASMEIHGRTVRRSRTTAILSSRRNSKGRVAAVPSEVEVGTQGGTFAAPPAAAERQQTGEIHNGKRRNTRRARTVFSAAAAVAMPVIALVLVTTLGVVLDLAVSPGRGVPPVVGVWISWPILAPFDFGSIMVPWLLLHWGYTLWVLLLFAVVSASGDAYPFGRQDLDLYPEEHRYDSFSPLGFNGMGVLLDLCIYSVLVPVIFATIMTLEQEHIREQTERAREKLVASVARAKQQQSVIMDAVLEQVPPFAQECMEAGVSAFETRPVVMAVKLQRSKATNDTARQATADSGWPTPTPTASDRHALPTSTDSRGSWQTEAGHMAPRPPARKGARSHASGAPTGGGPTTSVAADVGIPFPTTQADASSELSAVKNGVNVRVCDKAAQLCACLDDPVVHQWESSKIARYLQLSRVRGVLPAIAHQYTTSWSLPTTRSVAAAALGVLSSEGRVAISRISSVDWAAVSQHMRVDKVALDVPAGGRRGVPLWVGAAGMRTPVRSTTPLAYRDARTAAAMAFVAALGRFASAASRAEDMGHCLQAGISFPSSSQTAMMVGLMGLQQQPHEWAVFGGGLAEARRMVGLMQSQKIPRDSGIEGPSSLAQTATEVEEPIAASLLPDGTTPVLPPLEQTHDLCFGREGLDRAIDALSGIKQGVEAAIQWNLALAVDEDEVASDGGNPSIEPATLARGASAEHGRTLTDTQQGQSHLGGLQILRSSLRTVLGWLMSHHRRSENQPAAPMPSSSRGSSIESDAQQQGFRLYSDEQDTAESTARAKGEGLADGQLLPDGRQSQEVEDQSSEDSDSRSPDGRSSSLGSPLDPQSSRSGILAEHSERPARDVEYLSLPCSLRDKGGVWRRLELQDIAVAVKVLEESMISASKDTLHEGEYLQTAPEGNGYTYPRVSDPLAFDGASSSPAWLRKLLRVSQAPVIQQQGAQSAGRIATPSSGGRIPMKPTTELQDGPTAHSRIDSNSISEVYHNITGSSGSSVRSAIRNSSRLIERSGIEASRSTNVSVLLLVFRDSVRHTAVYRGSPALSSLLLGLIGASIAQATISNWAQVVALEVAAGLAEWSDAAGCLLHLVPFLPRLVVGLIMAWIGFAYFVFGTNITPVAACIVYGLAVGAHVLTRGLFVLEVVQETCLARDPVLNPAPVVLAAIQLLIAATLLTTDTATITLFSVAVALLLPMGPYRILQALLEGNGVRTQEEAAEACAAVWASDTSGGQIDQVLSANLLSLFVAAIYPLLFVLARFIQTKGLSELHGSACKTLDIAKSVARKATRQLHRAATSIVPGAILQLKLSQQSARLPTRKQPDGNVLRQRSISWHVFEKRIQTREDEVFSGVTLEEGMQVFPGLRRATYDSSGHAEASAVGIRLRTRHISGRRHSESLSILSKLRPQQVDLGLSVVATLLLHGFGRIADLAGPVASLGLHRVVGAVVDAVCAKYGAVRMRGGEGVFKIAWFDARTFASLSNSWNAHQGATGVDVDTGAVCVGRDSNSNHFGSKDLMTKCVLAGAELLSLLQVSLQMRRVAVQPTLGLDIGRLGACLVGSQPVSMLYFDSLIGRSTTMKPLQGSDDIANSLGRIIGGAAPRYTVHEQSLEPSFPELGVSSAFAKMWQQKHPALSVFLLGRIFVRSRRRASIAEQTPSLDRFGLPSSSGRDQPSTHGRRQGWHTKRKLTFHRVLWRAILRDLSGQSDPTTPHLGALRCLRCSLRFAGPSHCKAQQLDAVHSDKSDTTQWEWKQTWLKRLQAAINAVGAHSLSSEIVDESLHGWIQSCIATTKSHSTALHDGPTTTLTRNLAFLKLDIETSLYAACVVEWYGKISPEADGSGKKVSMQILVVNHTPVEPQPPPARAQDLSTSLPALPRSHMQDYRRLKVLGEGGFARVYLALHQPTGRRVALKVSRRAARGGGRQGGKNDASYSAGHSNRRASLKADVMRSEVRALLLSMVYDIPGVCELEGVALGNGEVGLVLELLEGPSLSQLLRSRPGRWRLRESAARIVTRHLACTIHRLHAAGVLHRDIKPSNVVLDGRGNARLIDFGLAKRWSIDRKADPEHGSFSRQMSGRDSDVSHGAAPTPEHWASEAMEDHEDLRLVLPMLSPLQMPCLIGFTTVGASMRMQNVDVSVLVVGATVGEEAAGEATANLRKLLLPALEQDKDKDGSNSGVIGINGHVTRATDVAQAGQLLRADSLMYDVVVVLSPRQEEAAMREAMAILERTVGPCHADTSMQSSHLPVSGVEAVPPEVDRHRSQPHRGASTARGAARTGVPPKTPGTPSNEEPQLSTGVADLQRRRQDLSMSPAVFVVSIGADVGGATGPFDRSMQPTGTAAIVRSIEQDKSSQKTGPTLAVLQSKPRAGTVQKHGREYSVRSPSRVVSSSTAEGSGGGLAEPTTSLLSAGRDVKVAKLQNLSVSIAVSSILLAGAEHAIHVQELQRRHQRRGLKAARRKYRAKGRRGDQPLDIGARRGVSSTNSASNSHSRGTSGSGNSSFIGRGKSGIASGDSDGSDAPLLTHLGTTAALRQVHKVIAGQDGEVGLLRTTFDQNAHSGLVEGEPDRQMGVRVGSAQALLPGSRKTVTDDSGNSMPSVKSGYGKALRPTDRGHHMDALGSGESPGGSGSPHRGILSVSRSPQAGATNAATLNTRNHLNERTEDNAPPEGLGSRSLSAEPLAASRVVAAWAANVTTTGSTSNSGGSAGQSKTVDRQASVAPDVIPPKRHFLHREKQAFVAGIAGTPLFMAPELFKHQGQRASDYWSLGVTLFWLLAGRMPFEGGTRQDKLDAARRGRVSWRLLPPGLSPECLDLLRGLLEPKAELRYDAAVLAAHPWLLPEDEEDLQKLQQTLEQTLEGAPAQASWPSSGKSTRAGAGAGASGVLAGAPMATHDSNGGGLPSGGRRRARAAKELSGSDPPAFGSLDVEHTSVERRWAIDNPYVLGKKHASAKARGESPELAQDELVGKPASIASSFSAAEAETGSRPGAKLGGLVAAESLSAAAGPSAATSSPPGESQTHDARGIAWQTPDECMQLRHKDSIVSRGVSPGLQNAIGWMHSLVRAAVKKAAGEGGRTRRGRQLRSSRQIIVRRQLQQFEEALMAIVAVHVCRHSMEPFLQGVLVGSLDRGQLQKVIDHRQKKSFLGDLRQLGVTGSMARMMELRVQQEGEEAAEEFERAREWDMAGMGGAEGVGATGGGGFGSEVQVPRPVPGLGGRQGSLPSVAEAEELPTARSSGASSATSVPSQQPLGSGPEVILPALEPGSDLVQSPTELADGGPGGLDGERDEFA